MIKVQFQHLDVPTWIHDHEHGTRLVYISNRHPDDFQVVKHIYVNGYKIGLIFRGYDSKYFAIWRLANNPALTEMSGGSSFKTLQGCMNSAIQNIHSELKNADFILRNPRVI